MGPHVHHHQREAKAGHLCRKPLWGPRGHHQLCGWDGATSHHELEDSCKERVDVGEPVGPNIVTDLTKALESAVALNFHLGGGLMAWSGLRHCPLQPDLYPDLHPVGPHRMEVQHAHHVLSHVQKPEHRPVFERSPAEKTAAGQQPLGLFEKFGFSWGGRHELLEQQESQRVAGGADAKWVGVGLSPPFHQNCKSRTCPCPIGIPRLRLRHPIELPGCLLDAPLILQHRGVCLRGRAALAHGTRDALRHGKYRPTTQSNLPPGQGLLREKQGV
mmetsp:Transcript_66403/g.151972  ORF Transcript_66403/g.151972 Transcript_66403/m.151972 type:complete len:273 (-) Transcript_66403:494-1312(-)